MTKKNLFYNGKRIAALSAAVMLAFASVPFRYMAPAYATEEADINYFDLTGVSLTDTWTTDGVTYELYDNGLLNLSGIFTGTSSKTGNKNTLDVPTILSNTRSHGDYRDSVKAINFDVDLNNMADTIYMWGLSNLEAVKFGDTFTNSSNCLTSLSSMFYNCRNLKTVEMAGRNLGNVKTASSMFKLCTSLVSVTTSDWDLSSVTNTSDMFASCPSLTSMDVSNWDVSNVKNMQNMFAYCQKLASLDVSQWNVSSVTDMSCLFSNCYAVTALAVDDWDVSNVKTLDSTFQSCSTLKSLNLNKWNTHNVTTLRCTFAGCSSITDLNISDIDTSNVTSMDSTFSSCKAIDTVDVSKWNVANVKSFSHTFSACHELTSVDVSKWDTESATSFDCMFSDCPKLQTIDVSNFDTSNATTIADMFSVCRSLADINVSKWNTANVTDISGVFSHCENLQSIDVSNWNVSNVTDMSNAFLWCAKLTEVDVSKWNPAKVTDVKCMFEKCSNITALDLSNFNLTNVNISSMLDDMNGLHMLKAPTLGILDTLYLPTVMSWLENNTYHEDMESSTLTGYNIDSMMGGAGSTIITNTDYAALQANGHRYTEWTSTDDTHEERHCTICGYSQTKEKHIHSYTSDITTQPTCDTPGVRTYTCAGCGDTYTEPIDALGHIQSEVHISSLDKAPTCTEDGYTYYEIRCSRDENGCGHKLLDEKKVAVAALGHNAGEPVIENRIEATYTTAGSYDEVIYCTRCNTELSRVHKTIPILTHSHVYEREVTKAPTCTEKGIETFTCKLCNDTYTDEIPALGHDWDNGTVTKAPACEEEGIRTYTCKRDSSHTYTEKIPMLLHTWGNPVTENVVEPTCTEAGHYDAVSYCTVCGKELERNTFTIGALGHVVGETVIENRVEPTCTEDGHYDEVHYCTRCNTELNRTRIDLDKLGHLAGEPKTSTISAPTCMATGTADKVTSCIRCKTELERTEITLPALGHIEGAIVSENSIYATCTEDGHFDAVVYCAREENGCNHSELFRTTIATPALGHSAGVPVIENRVQPTYDSEGGYDTVTYCTRCKIELSRVHTVLDRLTKEHIHDYKITDSKEATCLERGYTKHTCSCGDTYYDYTSALGHEPGEAVVENRVEAEVGIEGHYDEVIYCEREVNGCDHSELSRVTKTIPALEVPYEPGESTHIEIETTSDNSIVVPVVVATVAAISGVSAALIFFIYWRRRKVRGVVHGEVVNGLHITLEGKDNLETYTNEDGEFEFKNLKPDTYMLTIFDENDGEIFSTEIYTHAKKDENIFEVISSAVADNSLAKAGQTYIIDITR